jgi:hypothetical protein
MVSTPPSLLLPPARHPHSAVGARPARARFLLTVAVAALSFAAGVAGLLVQGVYTGPVSTAQMLQAFDVVTVLLVAPALVGAAHRARSDSVSGSLLVVSLLTYLVYTYAYYLFGTGFNDLFLLHVIVFATALVALVTTVASLNLPMIAALMGPRTSVRPVAVILGFLAIALGGLWVSYAVANAVSGQLPPGSALVETEAIVRLGMALDLALLVPLYAAAALLIWRKAAWGYVLASVALVAGLLHQVTYVLAMPFQLLAEVDGAVAYDPLEPVIVALYIAGLALLHRPRRRQEPASPSTS